MPESNKPYYSAGKSAVLSFYIEQGKIRYPIILFILFLPFIFFLPLSCERTLPPDERECLALSRQFITYMNRDAYDDALGMFNTVMKGVLPAEKLGLTWDQIREQAGRYEEEIYALTKVEGQFTQVFITCKFTNVPLDIKIVFTPKREISGLWFLPAYSSYDSYTLPDYVVKDSFHEREVVFGLPDWRLPGTLTLPFPAAAIPAQLNQYPVVILVHGSGPQDRDETIGPNKMFRDIAWGLASRGIAVFRYEKRTRRYPSKCAANNTDFTVKLETIDDAIEAVLFLKKQKEIDPRSIFVLGHSLGGMLIPRIAMRTRDASGFIVMAGPGRPLEQLLLEQITYLYQLDDILTDVETTEISEMKLKIAKLKQGDIILETKPEDLPMGIPAAYWLDLKGYLPQVVAAELKRPFLILQGGRDYQVTTTDYDLWKQELAAKENAKFIFYESLNHLFISGVGKSKPSEYFDPSHVEEVVIEDIAEWIGETIVREGFAR